MLRIVNELFLSTSKSSEFLARRYMCPWLWTEVNRQTSFRGDLSVTSMHCLIFHRQEPIVEYLKNFGTRVYVCLMQLINFIQPTRIRIFHRFYNIFKGKKWIYTHFTLRFAVSSVSFLNSRAVRELWDFAACWNFSSLNKFMRIIWDVVVWLKSEILHVLLHAIVLGLKVVFHRSPGVSHSALFYWILRLN